MALGFLVANMAASGLHVHTKSENRVFLESQGDCNESSEHVANHQVDGSEQCPPLCPSCQLRSQLAIAPAQYQATAETVVATLSIPLVEEPEQRFALRVTTRGPPLA